VNTEAQVYLPTMGLARFQVEESGTVLPLDSRYRGEVEGILSLVREDDYLEITIGSGSYHFVLKK